ncbi:MAG: HAD hydrolase-like protein [Pseudomonadota bacterium]
MELAVMFDLDGTLVESAPDIHAAVSHMLHHYERPAMDLTTLKGNLGAGVDIMLRNIMTTTGWELSEREFDHACQRYRDYYNERMPFGWMRW